jgi:hypothetical protein
MASEARSTLAKARYFADQAERLGARDKWFVANLEAAITFDRSTWYHLCKEYARRPGFHSWKAGQKFSPLAKFLEGTRHSTLHEGPVPVQRRISLSAIIASRSDISASLTVVPSRPVVPGRPWYRRRIKIVVPNSTYAISRLKRERAAAPVTAPPATTLIAGEIYFTDPQWKDRPALELLRQHFDELEKIIAEAEARF